jgi:hypothetical protein
MSFNTFMDAWVQRPIAGLPLRMIFFESWHRVHLCFFSAGIAASFLGRWIGVKWLVAAGFSLALLSASCFGMLVLLVPLFLTLEKAFPDHGDDK